MIWIERLGIWVAETEVTQHEFQNLMDMNPSNPVGSDLPVEKVTFMEAVEFCHRLQQKDEAASLLPSGYGYALPTDEQWDVYCGNARLDDAITSQNELRLGPDTVKSRRPNEYGLYDTRGNVWEWTRTSYDPSLNTPAIRAEFPFAVVQSGWRRGQVKGLDPNGLVLRGGSWRSKGDLLKKINSWFK
jgi:formylglycine-generating enzyme required for sulfatase activity